MLKSENMKDIDKKTDIEAIIGKIDLEFFTDLLTIVSNVMTGMLGEKTDTRPRPV